LIDGKAANDANRKAYTRQRINEADGYEPAIEPPPETSKIRSYLHGLAPQLFTSVTDRIPDAVEIAQSASFFENERARSLAIAQLRQIEAFPKPIYKPGNYSARLYAYGENRLGNLKSGLRPALYGPKDVELDLSKAHLSSFAKKGRDTGLDVSAIDAYLKRHLDGQIDLWSELAATLRLDDSDAARKAAKKIYAAVYGGDEQEVLRQVSNEYADRARIKHPGFDPFRALLNHPLVQAVMRARRRLLDRINHDGGMVDADGRFLELEDFKSRPNPDRSLMSYVASTYEIKLIGAAVDEALRELKWAEELDNRQPRFHIWLLQHDGFTMRATRQRDQKRMTERLQRVVAQKADEMGIITRLEVAWGLDTSHRLAA
jgi:hypothetical protein